MTKQAKFYSGQRAQYGADLVEIIGPMGKEGGDDWRVAVRVVRSGKELLAHPRLLKPAGRASARRGRVYFGYIEREFRKAQQEAEDIERGLAS